MKILKITTTLVGLILLIPILYLSIGLVLSLIPVHAHQEPMVGQTKAIYLSTNGVHLDVVLPRTYLSPELLRDLEQQPDDRYLAFGWGDKNFYLNTPTWADLTATNAASALLWNSPSLIHLTRYQNQKEDWTQVPINEAQIKLLVLELNQRFAVDSTGRKIILDAPGYYHNDHFYAATGHYHAFRTCNSWINDLFKKSGLKTSLWTPYDFGVTWWYE